MRKITIPTLTDWALILVFVALILATAAVARCQPAAATQDLSDGPIKVWMVHVDGKGTIPCMTLKRYRGDSNTYQSIYCIESWREDQ